MKGLVASIAFVLPRPIDLATFPLTLGSLRANPVGGINEDEKPANQFLS